ncbi:thioredoxin [Marinicauda salina]|uniref:Thioredoxin n=1 Tax=Marinicauda salina TaxID=2135793 RepID=A0A2U2BVW6_9PROT|nr:thioredoxin [Marinicauda salina]PWE18142.1 thioredoxin [Marinicauda salina]
MQILGADGQVTQSDATESPGPDSAGGDIVKDGTDQSFMQDVVEPSRQVPVLVDFWAPWCGPCRQLGPVIEKTVREAGGAVRLVKVNIDENPGVAGQLRIQSIPAVIAFQDGQPVDGFMGALPESQIKDFIKRLSGDKDEAAIEELIARADAALAAGDPGGAAQDYAAALQMDKESVAAIAGLARVHLAGGDADQARALLDSVPENKKSDPAIAGVRAAMELSGETEGAGDAAELARRAEQSPGDPEAHYELARARIAAGDLAGGADALLDSIGADREWNDEAARKLLLRVFDAAGPGSEVAKEGRRRLSSLLFS